MAAWSRDAQRTARAPQFRSTFFFAISSALNGPTKCCADVLVRPSGLSLLSLHSSREVMLISAKYAVIAHPADPAIGSLLSA